MEKQHWFQRNTEGFMTGLAVCIAWAGIGWLSHRSSPWFEPFFIGGIAAALVFLCCIGIIVARRLPLRRPVSTKNVDGMIREWLDNFKVTVKNDPSQELHFRYHLTLDSSIQMTVFRSRTEYPDYFTIVASLGMQGEDAKKLLGLFSETEIAQILIDVKLELARAKVGYGGLTLPPDSFHVFRRVPIVPGLTEFIFMSMVTDVEAAVTLVGQTLANARLQQVKTAGPAKLVEDFS